jgi:glycosyltransferase involved in cell wall biosynthesis
MLDAVKDSDMKLSVIIPVFNEMRTIQQVYDAVQAVDIDKEIILVDDFSTDGTRNILLNLNDANTRIILHDRNMGKGAALRTGFQYITGDVVIVQDADLEYSPQEYPRLLKPIQDGRADVVYGSRFVGGDAHRVVYFWHMVGNKLLTFLSNMFSNLNLTDMETCYKVMKREIVEQIIIEEDRFGFEPEITAKIAKLQVRIYEVGISYFGRSYREGKKVGWKDGFSALRCIVKYNLFRGWR